MKPELTNQAKQELEEEELGTSVNCCQGKRDTSEKRTYRVLTLTDKILKTFQRLIENLM